MSVYFKIFQRDTEYIFTEKDLFRVQNIVIPLKRHFKDNCLEPQI